MERRHFLKIAASVTAAVSLGDWEKLFAMGRTDPAVGKALAAWKKGQFQVHFIYTGATDQIRLLHFMS